MAKLLKPEIFKYPISFDDDEAYYYKPYDSTSNKNLTVLISPGLVMEYDDNNFTIYPHIGPYSNSGSWIGGY